MNITSTTDPAQAEGGSVTINEQIAIAKVMGWDYEERKTSWGKKFMWLGYGPSDNRVSSVSVSKKMASANPDFCTMPFAKLLQARMVEDGWEITINVGKDRVWIEALRFDSDLYHRIGVDHQYHAAGNNEMLTEQQSIVSLFMKVYGITEE